jgi:CDP-paratose 2-epimerase
MENAGRSRKNSISILEAINLTNQIIKKSRKKFSLKEDNRKGDHIWYVGDYSTSKKFFSNWKLQFSMKILYLKSYQVIIKNYKYNK